jgi:hypothetical protein
VIDLQSAEGTDVSEKYTRFSFQLKFTSLSATNFIKGRRAARAGNEDTQLPRFWQLTILSHVSIMPTQFSSARLAVLAGSGGLVLGMSYGMLVGICPHPQLALGAHVQFMQAGMMGIVAGLILHSPTLCQLNDHSTLLWIIDLAHYCLLVPAVAEGYASFKGLGMPLVNTLCF